MHDEPARAVSGNNLDKLNPDGIVWVNLGCAAHLFDRAKGLPGSRRKGTGLYIIPPEPRNLLALVHSKLRNYLFK